MESKKPLIIVFEGIDGSGKTTQARRIAGIFKKYRTKLLYEPGSTSVGENIRYLVKSERLSYKTELFLIQASRSEMIWKRFRNFNGIIILDRYIYSTIAYQGYGQGLDIQFIENVNNYVIGDYKPDCTFLFDIDPELSLKRTHRRDKFESINFLKRVRNGYLEMATKYNFIVIDATKPVDEITEIVSSKVQDLVNSFT